MLLLNSPFNDDDKTYLLPHNGTGDNSSYTCARQKISTHAFDGIVVVGYTDNGAYINCTGPAVKYTTEKWNLTLGLLPSIKIKEDNALVKNPVFTPTLGFGATLSLFKHLAIQIPSFYIPKTNTRNGRWTLGFGLGYKI